MKAQWKVKVRTKLKLNAMIFSKSALVCLALMTFSVSVSAHLPLAETTRMKATSGAGIASYGLNEAVFLNPASLTFFQMSAIYYQRTAQKTTSIEKNQVTPLPDGQTFIASDSKGNLKGSVYYATQSSDVAFLEGKQEYKQKEYGLALASAIAEKSSMGLGHRHISLKTKGPVSSNLLTQADEGIYTIGLLHAISPELSLGFVVYDPFQKTTLYNYAILGLQYSYKGFIFLLMDAGANYHAELSSTFLYRVAAQFQLVNDIYLQIGHFDDKRINQRGNSLGISWLSPKFLIDFAIKNIETTSLPKDSTLILSSESVNKNLKTRETSLSIGIHF